MLDRDFGFGWDFHALDEPKAARFFFDVEWIRPP